MKLTRRRLTRLFRMHPTEIAGRCLEQWRVLQEQLAVKTGRDSIRGVARGFDISEARAYFNEFQTRPFFFAQPGENRSATVQSFDAFLPGRQGAVLKCADQICHGAINLFGRKVTFPSGRIDWHLDWETGSRFPLQFYRSVTARNDARSIDLKRVWETNRQQFLLTLAKAYWVTRQPQYAEKIVSVMEDWIEANPLYRGINWKESLELAMRLLAWTFALRMIAGSEALTDTALHRILTSIAVQRDHVANHLSFYYSPNTHLLGEALALFVVDLAFPGIGRAGVNAREALGILETELSRQVAEDGSDREQSAYYHCYALDTYLLTTILGRQQGMQFSEYWMRRLKRMAEFLHAILRPDGSLARFGDDDGGRTLRLGEEDYYSPRSLLGVAAVLFGRGDFKQSAGELPEEVFWICGESGANTFLGLPEAAPSWEQRWFKDAKIAVLQSGPRPEGGWMVCLGQPMGFLSAGHSHAALLSFELVLGGQAIIVDPGTYTYEASSSWRNQFRSTEMHNTVQIDGNDFFLPAGPFEWEKIESLEVAGPGPEVSGSCRLGYKTDAGTNSTQHARTFNLESSRAASIADQFEGIGMHRLRFWLHFAPGIGVQRRSRHEFEIQGGGMTGRMTLKGFGDFEANSSSGTPVSTGWYSPRYGDKVPTTTLCIEEDVEFPSERSFRFECDRVLPDRHDTLTSSRRSSGE